MANEVEQLQQAFAEGKERVDHLFERINSELDFVEKLAQLHPDKAEEWRALAAEAAAKVTCAAGTNSETELKQAISEAEAILAPIGEVAKSYTIYCVGHAHIDMNWMWSWPETVAVTNDSFATVLKLMDEYPDFVFSQSQASTYRIIEEHNPAMLEQIKQRVKEGRWEVTASHWVEGDKNIASAESLCRHMLYTRDYMAKLFDLAPEDAPIDWAPDTFGHAHTMPTYLVRGGVKFVYLHRPGGEGPKRPRAFWWKGPDGSTVLVKNDMECGYNGTISQWSVQIMFNFCQETGLDFGLYVYGVGDHGGGPTRRDILRGYEMNTWPIYPTFKFATVKSFFERLEAAGDSLPTLDCELNYEFTGCYTTQTLVKKANRFAEARLQDAEFAATAAWGAVGAKYNACRFEEGWRDTLFSHFHDILPGSGVHDTRTFTHGLFQKTMAMTSMEETQSLRALAAAIDTSCFGQWELPGSPPCKLRTSLGSGVGMGAVDGGLSQAEQSAGSGNRPFVLFNPTDVERDEVVVATVWDNAWSWRTHELRGMQFSVRTPEGELMPAQTVDVGSYWGHDFVKLAFPAKVGKWGYSVYTIEEHGAAGSESDVCQLGMNHHCGYSMYERSPEGLENEFLKLELDTETGGIKSLVEKSTGATIICACNPALPLEYGVERPHGMTAWLVDHTGGWEAPELLSIGRRLKGPYKAAIDVRLRIHESEFTLTYEVRKGDPNLYLDLKGTWFQRGSNTTGVPVLRLALPLSLAEAQASYEIPFGAIERSMQHGEEVPALRWAEVAGKSGDVEAGVVLLNDSKHGYAFQDGKLSLTLIRSSYEPDPLPELGEHEIHMALRPFAGKLKAKKAIRAGIAFNHPVRLMGTTLHEGSLPAVASLIQPENRKLIVQAVKKAEGKDGLIVRLFDPMGEGGVAKLVISEILGQVKGASEVDLLERYVDNCTASTEGNTVSVTVPPRGIASVLIDLVK